MTDFRTSNDQATNASVRVGLRSLVHVPVLASLAVLVSSCGLDNSTGLEAPESPETTSEEIVSVEPDIALPPEPLSEDVVTSIQQAPAPADNALADTSDWVISPPWYAAGDAPFWRMDLVDGWFVFRRAGLPEIEAPIVPPLKDGTSDLFDTAPLTVVVSPSNCRTASGERGRAAVTVSIDEVEFSGCVFAGESAGASAEATAVTDAITSIDTCLAAVDEPALVTGIYERGGYTTALGLRTSTGHIYECATTTGGTVIAFLDPVDAANAGPWMISAMRFLRSGQGAQIECPNASPVGTYGQFLPKECRF